MSKTPFYLGSSTYCRDLNVLDSMSKFSFAFKLILGTAILASLGCESTYSESLPPRDHVHYPVGLAMHPSGDYLYVVNSNFDAKYKEELGGTLSIIDVNKRMILKDNGPYIPSFGGGIALNENATRAYVPTRFSNALLAFAITPKGDAIYCDKNSSGDAATSDPTGCTLQRVPDTENSPIISADPFDVAVSTLKISETLTTDLVSLSHLRGNDATSISIPHSSDKKSVDLSAASMRSAAITDGSSAIAHRPGTRDVFVGDRNGSDILVYSPYFAKGKSEIQALVVRSKIVLSHLSNNRADVRGLQFSPDGKMLYVITHGPDALHVVDLGVRDIENASGILYSVVDTISIDDAPSDIQYHEGPNGPLLYITSYDEGTIVVVDPKIPAVADLIETGEKPSRFVINKAQCKQGKSCEAYVSFFDDAQGLKTCSDSPEQVCGSIGIIELDPKNSRYHQLIGKIF